jgi:PKD repeat protein
MLFSNLSKKYLKLQKDEKPMTPRKPVNEQKVSSYSPLSRITSHIDPMVLYTFLALLVISITLLAFQASNRVDCAPAGIILASQHNAGKHNAFSTGEVITFKADIKNSHVSWNFGDSTDEAQGVQVYHAFNKAGNYTITLENGKCEWKQEVTIVNAIADNTPVADNDNYPAIEGPSEVIAGRAAVFTNSSSFAQKWQWQLLQKGAEVHTGKSVTFTFSSPGERILSLIVNGDTSKMVTKHIQVFPAEQGPHRDDHFEPMPFPEDKQPEPAAPAAPAAPEKPKVPAVSDDEFKFMLGQVVDKQKNAGDFSAYLCDNLSARVLLNDKDTDTFAHFCSRIRGKKRFKIELVNLIKDQNGCVKEIRIRYDKKFLGIF